MNQTAIDAWEYELDALGVFARIEDLEEHLAKAPAHAPSFIVLTDHIAAAKFAAKWLERSDV